MQRHKNKPTQLLNALESAKILRTLIPICAWCKCIRDEQGNWAWTEPYFDAQTDDGFTHSICPTCLEKERHKLMVRASHLADHPKQAFALQLLPTFRKASDELDFNPGSAVAN